MERRPAESSKTEKKKPPFAQALKRAIHRGEKEAAEKGGVEKGQSPLRRRGSPDKTNLLQ